VGEAVDADVAALAQALLDAGIDAAFPECDCAELVVIDRGFGSIVLGVPQQVVVRVPRTEVVAAAHVHERNLLPSIARHVPVAIPRVVWRASPAEGLRWGASAYRWIYGSQPLVPVAADGALVSDLAGFLATLHRTPVSLVAALNLPGPRALAGRRAEDAATIEPVLRNRLIPREFSRLQARLADILDDPVLDDFEGVLRHGDLWFGNLLIDEQSFRLNAVLDWEHAAIGDPAEDLATQRYLGAAAATAVTDHYARLIGGLDPQFLRRADHHFALREISGIRRCIEMNDDDELDEELQKLRSGPLLV
jgi:aminoglycoside 2''-phosphotransferase